MKEYSDSRITPQYSVQYIVMPKYSILVYLLYIFLPTILTDNVWAGPYIPSLEREVQYIQQRKKSQLLCIRNIITPCGGVTMWNAVIRDAKTQHHDINFVVSHSCNLSLPPVR